MKIVKIEWLDAQLQLLDDMYYESDFDNTNTEIYCSIVGFLIKETNNAYIIAKEVWDDGSFKYIHVIPKAVVTKIVELKEGKVISSNGGG